MAGGKDKHAAKRSKTEKTEKAPGSSSATPTDATPTIPLVTDISRVPAANVTMFANDRRNRVFFRNEEAWQTYNTRSLLKPVSKVYYYKLPEGIHLPGWELNRINQMINTWKWQSLIELDCKYNPDLVRLLYANMIETKEPWGLQTYYSGKEIPITIPVISQLLGITTDDDEAQVYPFRKWPQINVGTEDDYRRWLKLTSLQPPTAHSLPSVYQLGHTFINNILMPKADIKTNLEMNSVYFLRHLICADLQINVPYIIIRHMKQALPGNSGLPYAHLLSKLIITRGLNFPKSNLEQPINLFDCFKQLGWTQPHGFPSSWEPNNNQNNVWIKSDGAEPNQFTHPDAPDEPAQPQYPPAYDPSYFGSTSASGSFQYQGPWEYPPSTMPQNPHVGYLVKQMANLSTGVMHIMSNQAQTNQTLQNIMASQVQTNQSLQTINTRLDHVEEAQQHLSLNWGRQFGSWYTPSATIYTDAEMQQAEDTGTEYGVGGTGYGMGTENVEGEGTQGGGDDDLNFFR